MTEVTGSRLPAEPLLPRVRDVAKLLAVSERMVWSFMRNGDLPIVKVPGRRSTRVARADVDALVKSWRGGALTPKATAATVRDG